MDIPSIKRDTATNTDSLTDHSAYEYQKLECIKALEVLPKDKPTATVTFSSNVCQQVVSDLEKKGYTVKYSTNYTTVEKKLVSCLKITNPEIKDPVSELFDCFDGSVQYNNTDMNDKVKDLFVKFFSSNN